MEAEEAPVEHLSTWFGMSDVTLWESADPVFGMCPNRVEELEARVKELEASVEGLTDELVECKVRLRELEGAVDTDLGFSPSGDEEPAESPESIEEADSTKTEAPEEDSKAEDPEAEIIVA